MKKYKTVFIGNRPNILRILDTHSSIELVNCFTDEGLITEDGYRAQITTYKYDEGPEIIKYLNATKFDLLVSAGCPFKIPASNFSETTVLINSHPSPLPKGRGKHPINESLLSIHQTAGSTVHYMVDDFDAGDIIHQETFQLTEDVDARLLYGFIFELEAEVFSIGLQKLIDGELRYTGDPQIGDPTLYSRKKIDRTANLKKESTRVFLAKVRSFATGNLGVITELDQQKIVVYQAEKITNQFLIRRYEKYAPGTQLLQNQKEVLLIRTIDGLVKISLWAEFNG